MCGDEDESRIKKLLKDFETSGDLDALKLFLRDCIRRQRMDEFLKLIYEKVVLKHPELVRYERLLFEQWRVEYSNIEELLKDKDTGGTYKPIYLILPWSEWQKIELCWQTKNDPEKRYPIQRMFSIACAREVLPFFEKRFPEDKRPRNALEVAEKYAFGEATKEELDIANTTAGVAAHAAFAAARAAMYWRNSSAFWAASEAVWAAYPATYAHALETTEHAIQAVARNAYATIANSDRTWHTLKDSMTAERKKQTELLLKLLFGIITPEELRQNKTES